MVLNLLKNIHLFNYPISKVVLFYNYLSPIYETVSTVLQAAGIKFQLIRYGSLPLQMEHLSALKDKTDSKYILCYSRSVYIYKANCTIAEI